MLQTGGASRDCTDDFQNHLSLLSASVERPRWLYIKREVIRDAAAAPVWPVFYRFDDPDGRTERIFKI